MSDLLQVSVTLNKDVNVDDFIAEITANNIGNTYIPNRAVEVADILPHSSYNIDFKLSSEEANLLMFDNRVRDVRVGTLEENNVALKRFTFAEPRPATNDGSWAAGNTDINWGLAAITGNTGILSSNSIANYSRPYTLDGTGVDIVIMDTGLQMDHPEFTNSANVTRTQRVDWFAFSTASFDNWATQANTSSFTLWHWVDGGNLGYGGTFTSGSNQLDLTPVGGAIVPGIQVGYAISIDSIVADTPSLPSGTTVTDLGYYGNGNGYIQMSNAATGSGTALVSIHRASAIPVNSNVTVSGVTIADYNQVNVPVTQSNVYATTVGYTSPRSAALNDPANQASSSTIYYFPTGNVTGYANFYTDNDGHATHVAGIAAGKTYGWARNANIYVFNINGTTDNGEYDFNAAANAQTGINLIKFWHQQKPITSTGFRRPTIVNGSWGLTFGASIVANYSYRGNAVINTTWNSVNATALTDAGLVSNSGYTANSDYLLYRSTAIESDLEDAIANGVIFVGAAGNDSFVIDNGGGANGTVTLNSSTISGLTSMSGITLGGSIIQLVGISYVTPSFVNISGINYAANSVTISGAWPGALSSVSIANTSGGFSSSVLYPLNVGNTVTVSGTLTGSGTISGYTNPTTYYIIGTDGYTNFTLSASNGGGAITTTAGTTTGLTFSLANANLSFSFGGKDYQNLVGYTGSPAYAPYTPYNRGAGPFAITNSIIVGAVQGGNIGSQLAKAPYSATGNRVDVFAPGSNITSAMSNSYNPAYTSGVRPYPGNTGYKCAKLSGTSQSTPQVTGLAACLLQARPFYTSQDVKAWLAQTADTTKLGGGDLAAYNNFYSLQTANNRLLYNTFNASTVTNANIQGSGTVFGRF